MAAAEAAEKHIPWPLLWRSSFRRCWLGRSSSLQRLTALKLPVTCPNPATPSSSNPINGWANRSPLLRYLDNPSPLSHGRWLVLLVHTDCPDCRGRHGPLPPPLLPLRPPRACRSPSHSSSSPPALTTPVLPASPNITLLQLPTTHDWFASTPTAIQLTDGIVTRVLSAAQAADPAVAMRD